MYNANQTYRNSIVYVFFIVFLALSLNSPEIKCQERFLLNPSEMPEYEIVRQTTIEWIVGEGSQMRKAIQQKWHVNGRDDRDNIYVECCEFTTEAKAIRGTAYAAQTFATPSIWGSQTGSSIGDNSWVFIDGGGIFFVRANVGIKINLWVSFNENDLQLLLSLSSKLLHKVESNLSPEILALEAAARQKQIPLENYQKITKSVVNSELMNGFSLHTTSDSKWLIESDSTVMGIRQEWKNSQGAIIEIDICQFDSDLVASKAASLQGRNTYSEVFNLNNLDSLSAIITKWQNEWKPDLPKNLFSVVGLKKNIAIHVYDFNPTGFDSNFFYSIVEKLSKQI